MDKKTIKTYDSLAKEYDKETSGFWEQFPKTFFNKFIQLNGKTRVLNIGSGPGRDGLILRNAGLDVTCLDASKSMIKLSTECGLNSVLGDFNSLPFQSGEFDGVWAYTSLLHVPKSEVVIPLSEINRVLKFKGIFGAGFIEGDSESYKENLGVGKPRWFSYYKKEELENLLNNNGFKVVYFEEFKPSTKKYLNFISEKYEK